MVDSVLCVQSLMLTGSRSTSHFILLTHSSGSVPLSFGLLWTAFQVTVCLSWLPEHLYIQHLLTLAADLSGHLVISTIRHEAVGVTVIVNSVLKTVVVVFF